jgi:alginate biosynthesis protein AlgX
MFNLRTRFFVFIYFYVRSLVVAGLFAFTFCSFGSVVAAQEDIVICDAAKQGDFPLYTGLEGFIFSKVDVPSGKIATDEQTVTYLKRLNEAFRKQGIYLVIASVPMRGLINSDFFSPQEQVLQSYDLVAARQDYLDIIMLFESAGIIIPNLLDGILSNPEVKNFSMKRDPHWSPTGARIVALLLANVIKEVEGFNDLPKREFETQATETLQLLGRASEVLEKACPDIAKNYTLEETLEKFITVEKEGASLLGDTGKSGVTLVGTSYSDGIRPFNFAGFLREFLGTDVENAALGGHGIWDGMIKYLASDTYLQNKPKILIWEIPMLYFYDSLGRANRYRQLIPSIQGFCDASRRGVTNTTLWEQETVQVLDLTNLTVATQDAYLALHLSDASFADFEIVLEYKSGETETFPIRRIDTASAPNYPNYFVELRTDEGNLSTVTLAAKSIPASSISVEAAICHYH